MSATQPFAPHYGSTQALTAAAASASTGIAAQDLQVRILNTGSNIAYVRIGEGAQTAAATDFPIAPGQCSTITMASGDNTLAHISPAGTTLVITTGNGW